MEKRKIAILGSTGSIGTQALDVVRHHRDKFEIELLTANNNYELLAHQAIEFEANHVVICNEEHYEALKELLKDTYTKVWAGMDSVCELVKGDQIDMVLTATVGFSGLRPTVAAIEANKPLALANKETLVAGGPAIMKMVKDKKIPLLPVDSEHSAIFQCLMGAAGNPITKIHLTASGGPFRTWTKEEIALATKESALKHPQWNMGAKITIDSATMMNKGFEMIEARWLFDVSPENIEIVVHPQSIIHSMIEFEDGAILAQMGHPDMREPIQFALAFPERLPLNNKKINFADLAQLTFEKPDTEKFPCLGLAFEAIRKGGNLPCAMNAANEAAVAAFLHDQIAFYDIAEVIEKIMDQTNFIAQPSIDDILATNEEMYAKAAEMIRHL